MKKKKLQIGNIQQNSPKLLEERSPKSSWESNYSKVNKLGKDKKKKKSVAIKSFYEEGIPKNRVAPGASPPPGMSKGGKLKKNKMRHGQY